MNGESRVEPLVLTRHFKAPPERIFAAFTEKALMQTWYGPESMTVPHCEVDARVGGKYRVEMHAPSGTAHIVTGEFKEIDAPRRLVFSWGWLNGNGRLPETLVTLTFTPRDGGTDLELVQTGFLHEARRDGHRGGWNSTLNSLDAALEGKPKPVAPVPTLFGDYRSSYLRAARIAFAEKGIACGLKTCAPHSPDILAHHPWGKMPALKVGEESLYETSAILRYVDEAYPGPALMPGRATRPRQGRAIHQRVQGLRLPCVRERLRAAIPVSARGRRGSGSRRDRLRAAANRQVSGRARSRLWRKGLSGRRNRHTRGHAVCALGGLPRPVSGGQSDAVAAARGPARTRGFRRPPELPAGDPRGRPKRRPCAGRRPAPL